MVQIDGPLFGMFPDHGKILNEYFYELFDKVSGCPVIESVVFQYACHDVECVYTASLGYDRSIGECWDVQRERRKAVCNVVHASRIGRKKGRRNGFLGRCIVNCRLSETLRAQLSVLLPAQCAIPRTFDKHSFQTELDSITNMDQRVQEAI